MPAILNFIIAIFAIIVLLPVIIITSLLILLLDGWPIFFYQKRIGKNFKYIWVFKFRTMKDSEKAKNGLVEIGQTARITKLGAVLRKTKIDEIPQFFNVLLNQMSIVGPRAQSPEWVSYYEEKWKKILKIKPGITDPASIKYCNEEEILEKKENPKKYYIENILSDKINIYQKYVDERSTFNDIKIIIKTIATLVIR
jgi:lipopolysaccharide/colanic/teichoic acid biosynthesis glycosyltransferase